MLSNVSVFIIFWLERELACRRLLDRLQIKELAKRLKPNERKRKNSAGRKTVSGRPTLQPVQETRIRIWRGWFPALNPSPIGSRIWTRRASRAKVLLKNDF